MLNFPVRPTPLKDFNSRASGPLEHGDNNISYIAAKRMTDLSSRKLRSIDMAYYPVNSLPSWLRHHVGEAYSMFSCFVEQGGTVFCPELDDPREVCDRLANFPESLLDRLEPSFIGLEREADPDEFFKNWYLGLCQKYIQDMKTVKLISGPDYKKRYQKSALVLQKFIPEITAFFDNLREFIGNQACLSSRWKQGDVSRAKWDLAMFERDIVWGGAAFFGLSNK